MFYIALMLFIIPLYGMEQNERTYTFTIHEKRTSYDPRVSKALKYFLGSNSPQCVHGLEPFVIKKVQQSQLPDEEIWQTVENLKDEDVKLSDSQDIDQKLKALRLLIAESVYEALKEKDEVAVEAQMQLQLKNKELRSERYKFYAALVGAGATTVTTIGSLIALLVATN